MKLSSYYDPTCPYLPPNRSLFCKHLDFRGPYIRKINRQELNIKYIYALDSQDIACKVLVILRNSLWATYV